MQNGSFPGAYNQQNAAALMVADQFIPRVSQTRLGGPVRRRFESLYKIEN